VGMQPPVHIEKLSPNKNPRQRLMKAEVFRDLSPFSRTPNGWKGSFPTICKRRRGF
jgi:hypothetical protein